MGATEFIIYLFPNYLRTLQIPEKLSTTACFIQEESSGGREFRKHVSCFYA